MLAMLPGHLLLISVCVGGGGGGGCNLYIRDLEQSLGELGWKGVSVEDMRRLSSGEIRQMLRDSAWRMVREAWDAEIQERSKLGVVKGLLECGCQS